MPATAAESMIPKLPMSKPLQTLRINRHKPPVRKKMANKSTRRSRIMPGFPARIALPTCSFLATTAWRLAS